VGSLNNYTLAILRHMSLRSINVEWGKQEVAVNNIFLECTDIFSSLFKHHLTNLNKLYMSGNSIFLTFLRRAKNNFKILIPPTPVKKTAPFILGSDICLNIAQV